MDESNDPNKDTQFFLGKLSGEVDNLGKQVSGFDKRLAKKEETDRIRFERQIENQSKHAEKIFDKIDEIKEMAHGTPCSAVEAAQNDLDLLEDEIGIVDRCVRKIKTTGQTGWRALVVGAAIAGFVIASIAVPLLIYYWSKG